MADHSPKYDDAPAPLRRGEFAVRALVVVGLLVLLGFLVFLLWRVRQVVFMVFAGLLLAVFLRAPAGWLNERLRLRYGASLSLVVVLLVALVGLGGWLIGAQLTNQMGQLAQRLPTSLESLRDQLRQYEWGQWILAQTRSPGEAISQFANSNALSGVTGIASGALWALTAAVVIAFIGLYAAAEPGFYRNGVVRLFPRGRRKRAAEVLSALETNLRWWLLVRLVSMTVIGVFTAVGLWLLGVPMALALGALAFMLVVIPNIGPVLAGLPAVLLAWAHGGASLALYVLLFYTALQALESYVLLPLLERRAVYQPPVLTLAAIALLGAVGGVLGMLVAAPMMLTIVVLVKMVYVEDILGDRTLDVFGEEHEQKKLPA